MTQADNALQEAGPPTDDAGAPRASGRRGRAFRATAFVVLIALSLAAAVESWNLGLWASRRPGPGLWPFLISVTMFGCAAGAWLRERRSEAEAPPETSWRRELVAFGSVVAYIMGFAYLGLVIPTLLLLVLWLKALANEPWRLVLPLSVAGTAVIYVVFDVLLGVPFPNGVLGVVGM
ncbi:tripartite tricarboxylate transporter TctB family protein [Prauserella oleivorans]|uniref:Tripartite tricarboxylate transporter TctB family protein n=1 Tax=Prauserella oleivorans TaxID=1478153 RepID=A0ABW5W6Y6_9PSEU